MIYFQKKFGTIELFIFILDILPLHTSRVVAVFCVALVARYDLLSEKIWNHWVIYFHFGYTAITYQSRCCCVVTTSNIGLYWDSTVFTRCSLYVHYNSRVVAVLWQHQTLVYIKTINQKPTSFNQKKNDSFKLAIHTL